MAMPNVIHGCATSCTGCPFNGPKVGSKGHLSAPVVIVGESPGSNERRLGYPFAGSSGKVLHGLIPEESTLCLYLNAMQCIPPQSSKKTAKLNLAVRACHERLIAEVSLYPRKIIIALGNAAVQSLTGDPSLKITQVRGRLIPSKFAELGIMPAVHPAALMRGTGSFRQFKEDLLYAWELANGSPMRSYTKPQFLVADSTAVAREFVKHLSKYKNLTGDIETSSLSPHTGRIISFAAAIGGDVVYVFPEEYYKLCKPILESQAHKWCWHNGKYDIQFFHAVGIAAKVDDDTMLMSYVLDENPSVHDLETVGNDVIGAPDYKYMIKPYLPNKESSYDLIPKPILHDYNSIDAGNTARLRKILRARIAVDPVAESLYTKLLIPASKTLTEIEKRGIAVDLERVMENDQLLRGEMREIEVAVAEIIGRSININSPAQLKDLFYNVLKYPDKNKGSTDADTLDALPQTPLIKLIKRYRTIAKQHGTYVKSIIGVPSEDVLADVGIIQEEPKPKTKPKTKTKKVPHLRMDGRVHATYLIHGTVTGRLSSRKPNMQNIPRDSSIRGQFVASKGYVLIEVDLSQAELRSLACMSGDEDLIGIFSSGKDPHGMVAERFFGTNWTEEDRVIAKNVNFGIIYGITGVGLAEQLGISVREADTYIQAWYRSFPRAARFISKCRSAPRELRTIKTAFGRQRRIALVTRGNIKGLENEAANFPHQATASDITLEAANIVLPVLQKRDIHIVNLIHDAQLLECPNDRASIHFAANFVKDTMQQVPINRGLRRVPFIADIKVGHAWGNLSKVKANGEYGYILETKGASDVKHKHKHKHKQ